MKQQHPVNLTAKPEFNRMCMKCSSQKRERMLHGTIVTVTEEAPSVIWCQMLLNASISEYNNMKNENVFPPEMKWTRRWRHFCHHDCCLNVDEFVGLQELRIRFNKPRASVNNLA